jgi:hypothetical protein
MQLCQFGKHCLELAVGATNDDAIFEVSSFALSLGYGKSHIFEAMFGE